MATAVSCASVIDLGRNLEAGTLQSESQLCPACGSNRIRIETITRIEFEVELANPDDDFTVTQESVGDSEWSPESPARCSRCSWKGLVADLLD